MAKKRAKRVWIGLSLFISSGIFAYIASLILGGGMEVFGVVLGVDILQNLICFAGGAVMYSGIKGGGKKP